jgi:hypothetical protein
LIFNKISYNNILAFTSGYSSQVEASVPFGWHIIKFLKTFTGIGSLSWIYFLFFIIGLVTLLDLVFGYDLIKKEGNKKLKADLFNALVMIVTLAFFIFYIRVAEDRWVILLAVPMFLFIGKGIMYVTHYFKNMNVNAKFLIVLLILLIGMFGQVVLANNLILERKYSYAEVKEAALWMKENTEKQGSVVSNSGPQTTYYSDRRVIGWGSDEQQLENDIKKYKPKYLTISKFERHSDWVYSYAEKNKERLSIAKVYPEGSQQPMLVIYEMHY